jgi:hypothetical protein
MMTSSRKGGGHLQGKLEPDSIPTVETGGVEQLSALAVCRLGALVYLEFSRDTPGIWTLTLKSNASDPASAVPSQRRKPKLNKGIIE